VAPDASPTVPVLGAGSPQPALGRGKGKRPLESSGEQPTAKRGIPQIPVQAASEPAPPESPGFLGYTLRVTFAVPGTALEMTSFRGAKARPEIRKVDLRSCPIQSDTVYYLGFPLSLEAVSSPGPLAQLDLFHPDVSGPCAQALLYRNNLGAAIRGDAAWDRLMAGFAGHGTCFCLTTPILPQPDLGLGAGARTEFKASRR
jgi:hypothetical protein